MVNRKQCRNKPSKQVEIAEALRLRIREPGFTVGDKLPTIIDLAKEFDVSVRTVHQALERLQEDGYIYKINGVGSFVTSRYSPMTLQETAAVCMESGVHLYGELWSSLMEALQTRHMIPMGMDTMHGDAHELISRLFHADIQYFLVHWTSAAQWDLFRQPMFQNKPVFAFFGAPDTLNWPNLYQIRSDFPAMAKLAAEYLWSTGHRHVLIVGTHSDKTYLRNMAVSDNAVAPSLVEAWEALGGTWRFINSINDVSASSLIRYDEDELVAALTDPAGVDAIMGTRDVDVWEAQQVLRRRLPERLDKLGYCGMFDTPWSRAGSPPFTTISVDVPAMVTAAMEMIDALRAGKAPYDRFVRVPPKVVVRTPR